MCAMDLINMSKEHCTVNIRVGCAIGTILSGILSQFKFCFDVYGSAVTLGEHLSSVGDAGSISLSNSMYSCIASTVDAVTTEQCLTITKSKAVSQTCIVDASDDQCITIS